MSAPTVLIGYGPDIQESGVWFGPPNCVSRRGWLPCEPSLVWVFLPDPRAKPVHCMRAPAGGCQNPYGTLTVDNRQPTLHHTVDTSRMADSSAAYASLGGF